RLPGGISQRATRPDNRPRDRSELALHPLRRHARAEGLDGRNLSPDGGRERRRDGPRPYRRGARMHDRDAVALIEAIGLRAGYGASVALGDVEFELRRGERMAVLGPNGGGKSTLVRVLLGELETFGGELTRHAAAAFVPQTERSRLDYPVSALDVALMGTLSRLPWWRPNGPRERRFAREALARVGLAE